MHTLSDNKTNENESNPQEQLIYSIMREIAHLAHEHHRQATREGIARRRQKVASAINTRPGKQSKP
jgi:DNA invertase Pin-like site-specific DNA recombinase